MNITLGRGNKDLFCPYSGERHYGAARSTGLASSPQGLALCLLSKWK